MKYVIEHGAVGEFHRGDVVDEEIIRSRNGDVERLLGLRAMRAATAFEAELTHVDLPNSENARSFQAQLAESEQEKARMRNRIRELEEQVAMRAQPLVKQTPMHGTAPLIQEKDQTIMDLQTRIKQATEQANRQESAPTPSQQVTRQEPIPAPAPAQATPQATPPAGSTPSTITVTERTSDRKTGRQPG